MNNFLEEIFPTNKSLEKKPDLTNELLNTVLNMEKAKSDDIDYQIYNEDGDDYPIFEMLEDIELEMDIIDDDYDIETVNLVEIMLDDVKKMKSLDEMDDEEVEVSTLGLKLAMLREMHPDISIQELREMLFVSNE